MGSYYTLYTIFYNLFYVPNISVRFGPSLVSNRLPIFGAKNQTEPDL